MAKRVQSQCEACGRFAAYPQDFVYDAVCRRCENDPRPGVQERRDEARQAYERVFGGGSRVE